MRRSSRLAGVQASVTDRYEESQNKESKKRKTQALDNGGKNQRRRGSATSTEEELAEHTRSRAKQCETSRDGPTRRKEEDLWAKGFQAVGGLDEAGRGPLAGPVVAACCVLPRNPPGTLLRGLNDSKLLTEEQREELYARLTTTPDVLWAIKVIDHTTIDRINILQAALRAMREAAQQLPLGSYDYLLVDGNKVPAELAVPAEAVVKGDATCSCIAAASVIAKVTRDHIMHELDAQYPMYNFRQHKGYGVPEHTEAIHKHGPCAIHRHSFQPIRGITGWTRADQLAAEAAAAAKPGKATDQAADTAAVASSLCSWRRPLLRWQS